MSVRREKRKDPTTGTDREYWMIDFTYHHPDGRKERVRKVAPIQNKRAAERHEHELRHALHDGSYRKEQEAPPPEPPRSRSAQARARAASRRLHLLLGAPFLSTALVSSSRCANHS